jgi:hypothetical protein
MGLSTGSKRAGLDNAADVLDLVERMAGRQQLTAQVQFFVEAVLDDGPNTDEHSA